MQNDKARLDREEFMTLPLDQLAARTGLTPPASPTPDEERAWRERAYRDYQVDIENADEWGVARQGEEPPHH